MASSNSTLKWEMGSPKPNDDVKTPSWLLKDLKREFGDDLFDPCPYMDEEKKGLEIEWGQTTFVNPPYSNVRPWLEKAIEESQKGKTILFLIPFKPQAKYFQERVLAFSHSIRLYSKDIVFQGFHKPTPFSMSLVIFQGPGKRKRYPTVTHDQEANVKKRKKGHTWQYYTLA